ncbi:MAG: lycopene cyclase family protein [Bacteroidota bacterium]
MFNRSFDYAIVGAGAAGLHLAIQLSLDEAFADKRILIVDKDLKNSNDHTWSFWENKPSKWDEIAKKTWNKAIFYTHQKKMEIPLKNYYYKSIQSVDFYPYAKEIIHSSERFEWVKDDISEIVDRNIIGKKETYIAGHIFDSRIPEQFSHERNNYISLVQHFLGWFIKTPEPVFHEEVMTIMDYRLKWENQTSFHYILPFSSTYALVEFTLFNEHLLQEKEYEKILREYISEVLKIKHFEILEKEIGQIPMSTYPFEKHHKKHVTKIGTAGGWVRPSSGYSFKNAERYSKMIVDNLKEEITPYKGITTPRFRFYDKILLGVLKERNDLGEEIFEKLYTKQPIQSLFRFLDEQSTWLEDVRIMFSLNKPIFRKKLIESL